jgi:hypothetical protein
VDADALRHRKLAERALRDGGSLPLQLLLEMLVPVRRLRELAQRLGLSPKGFRVDRAPARVLAVALADLRVPEQLDQVVALLTAGAGRAAAEGADHDAASGDGGRDADGSGTDDRGRGDDAPAAESAAQPPGPEGTSETAAALRLREQEAQRLRADLERARQGVLRGQERETALRQAAERDQEQIQQLRGELQRTQRRVAAPAEPPDAADRAQAARVHELEQELVERDAQDEAMRRQLAAERTRVRALEQDLAEVEALLPKGRRRKAPPPPEPEPTHHVPVPHFLPSFYRSLDGKDRRSIERAMIAIMRFCTEGHAYPGLDVKQLGGQDTWSLRASLGLRVYFRPRSDGDVEFLELADREEQNTTLRRLKER